MQNYVPRTKMNKFGGWETKVEIYALACPINYSWCATIPKGFNEQRDFCHVGWY